MQINKIYTELEIRAYNAPDPILSGREKRRQDRKKERKNNPNRK